MEFTEDMQFWIEDGNVIQTSEDCYIEQSTQWNVEFTKEELIKFFNEKYG